MVSRETRQTLSPISCEKKSRLVTTNQDGTRDTNTRHGTKWEAVRTYHLYFVKFLRRKLSKAYTRGRTRSDRRKSPSSKPGDIPVMVNAAGSPGDG